MYLFYTLTWKSLMKIYYVDNYRSGSYQKKLKSNLITEFQAVSWVTCPRISTFIFNFIIDSRTLIKLLIANTSTQMSRCTWIFSIYFTSKISYFCRVSYYEKFQLLYFWKEKSMKSCITTTRKYIFSVNGRFIYAIIEWKFLK